MTDWVRCKDRLPEDGQKVFYFGILGLWRGRYVYQALSHWITEDEHGNTIEVPATDKDREWWTPHSFVGSGGSCDTDEVTHWLPDDREDGWVPLPPGYQEMRKFVRDVADGEFDWRTDQYEQAQLLAKAMRIAEDLVADHREFV